MQARYYDPVIGRFYSNDPVDAATFVNRGDIQGFNRYAYTFNNPYKYTDPDGATPAHVAWAIGYGAYRGYKAYKAYKKLQKARKALEAASVLSEAADSEVGSYTNTHASGKRYHGKGTRKRSQQSGRRKARQNDDPHVATDWTPSASDQDAFVDEATRIENDGGVENEDNYNEINSPGKKKLDEQKEQPQNEDP